MQESKNRFLRPLVLTSTVLLILIIIVPLFVRFSIDLTEHKDTVESVVAEVLGRDVKVAGAITVTTSLWPYFEIHGISIANPKGFEKGDTASMDRARVTVGLLSLLQKRVRVRKFHVKGLTLDLQRNEAGDVNWVFQGLAAKEPQQPKKQSSPSSTALAVDDLRLENIKVSFHDELIQHDMKFSIEQATGSAAFGKPMNLSMNGTLLDFPFTMNMKANSLGEFLAMTHSQLETDIELAQTHIHFSGSSDAPGRKLNAELDVSIEGDRLDNLDDLLGIDLPPLEDYRLSAKLQASRGRFEFSNIVVVVKNSTLNGNVVIDKTGAKPFATVDLSADSIQLADFDIGLLTRMHNPDSKVSGPLNIDLDVTSMARGVRGFLKGSNGYFDISGTPENTSSGAVDLWAINLLSSVVESSAKKEKNHEVNCLISRWSLENGLMTAKNVAVDTSRIRICVKGDIDFNKQTIKLKAFPTAKRPEFFSLATPVAVNGKFEDFRVGAEMGVLAVVPPGRN